MMTSDDLLLALAKGNFWLKLKALRAEGFVRGRWSKLEITPEGKEYVRQLEREKAQR